MCSAWDALPPERRHGNPSQEQAVLAHVGRNLRKIRRDRDLSQTVVSRLAGIRQQELSAIENGLQPKLALVERLSRVLGVHPDALLCTPPDVSQPSTVVAAGHEPDTVQA
jgi:transcriptional regulator with XRE-family HTH domain